MPPRKPAPNPIDAREPRFNQGVLAFALLAGFVFHASWVIPVWCGVLALGGILGRGFAPFLRLYGQMIAPRINPPIEFEDPRPSRFAALFGSLLLLVATMFLYGGESGLAWLFALAVAGLGALDATTSICVGCELYARLQRQGDKGSGH